MAIDNIFLGLGRKSVGDVTLYRRAGKQCARVRVRNVRNPRSYKQLFTRSILSNVAQLYATGIEIFNHAFEGRSVGMENQKRFMKLNVDRLRAMMTADYNSGAEPSACKARIGARNLKVGVPFEGLQVSEGNYSQTFFTYDPAQYGYIAPAVAEGETVAAYARRVGLIPDDIYTFVCFDVQPWKDYMANYGPESPTNHLMAIYPCYMAYAQLKVKANILSDNTPITSSSLLLSLFDYYGGEDVSDVSISEAVTQLAVFVHMSCGGIACIRSKWGTDLRSTSFLQPSHEDGFDFGITYHLLEQAWGDQAGINRADLILDGDNFGPGESGTDPGDFVGMRLPSTDTAGIKAIIQAMDEQARVSIIFGGWLLQLYRTASDEVDINFADPLGGGLPSLKYEFATGSDFIMLSNYRSEAIDAGWMTDIRNELAMQGWTINEGSAVTSFSAPVSFTDY